MWKGSSSTEARSRQTHNTRLALGHAKNNILSEISPHIQCMIWAVYNGWVKNVYYIKSLYNVSYLLSTVAVHTVSCRGLSKF